MPSHGVPRLPGESSPQQVVKATRSAQVIRAEAKLNAVYRKRFKAAVERHEQGGRGAIHEVLAIGREISRFAHGRDHTLWEAYYNAVRLCWTPPGAGYENRAITARDLTAEAARSHVPSYEERTS